ncbi:MAG: dTDP-4-dehydrorhamnose reductase [bacterium]|nr:dTDP-4-dehydrorhamnose reductase [bacterium]
MKFLVFGSKGQLGKELIKNLMERNFEVSGFSHEEIDITDYVKVEETIRVFKPDVIINATAYNKVDKAEEEPEIAFQVNAFAVKNLAELANKYSSILVHFSTDYVFDGKKGAPYTTIDLPNPINTYGKSKLQGEIFVQEIAKRYFLIRVSWVFGFGKTNFPLKLIEMASQNKVIKVATDQVNSPTYTIDSAKGIIELILKGKFGLYHVANSGYCSRYEWAEAILKNWGWEGELLPAKTEDFPSLAKRPLFTALDTSKFTEETGFIMPDWRDAVKRFIKKLREIKNVS